MPELEQKVDKSMSDESSEKIQRRTIKGKAALVLSIMKGKTSVAEAARPHGLTVAEIGDCKEWALFGLENSLRLRPKDEETLKDEQVKKLKRWIGGLVNDIDMLKEAQKPYLPTVPGRSNE